MKEPLVVERSGKKFLFVPFGMRPENLKGATRWRIIEVVNNKALDFWQSDAKVKALFGANRSGKTETALIEVVWWLMGEHPFRDVPKAPFIRWVLPDYGLIEMVLRDKLLKYLPPKVFVGDDFYKAYDKRYHRIRFKNGGILEMKSHSVGLLGLEGVSLDLVVIDEECPFEVYRTLLMRTIDTGGQVIITATPLKGMTWLYSEIYTSQSPYIYKDTLRIEDNTALDPEEVAKVADLVKDPRRLKGEFADSRVFPELTDDLLGVPPDDGVYYGGLDWGYQHPSAYVSVKLSGGTIWVCGVLNKEQTSLGEFLQELKGWTQYRGEPPMLVVFDSQLTAKDTNAMIPATKVYEHFNALPATKKLELSVAVVNELCRRGLLRFKKTDDGVMRLFRRMQHFTFRNGKLPETGDDDMDALRYIVFYLVEQGLTDYKLFSPPDTEEDEDIGYIRPVVRLTEKILEKRRKNPQNTPPKSAFSGTFGA